MREGWKEGGMGNGREGGGRVGGMEGGREEGREGVREGTARRRGRDGSAREVKMENGNQGELGYRKEGGTKLEKLVPRDRRGYEMEQRKRKRVSNRIRGGRTMYNEMEGGRELRFEEGNVLLTLLCIK